jgi:hypothetical protein
VTVEARRHEVFYGDEHFAFASGLVMYLLGGATTSLAVLVDGVIPLTEYQVEYPQRDLMWCYPPHMILINVESNLNFTS